MYIQSVPFSILFLYTFFFCAASGQPHWTNSSSIPTRTSTSIALPGVNIRPPLSLVTGSSYTSSHTGTPEYNYFTAIESYASTTYGPAVFNHTTFQSVCPSSPRESARACYSTCTSFANACRDLHSSWSGKNADYQSSMNEKHFGGTSSRVGDSVSTNTEGLSTSWSYDTSWATSLTTVDILAQFGESQKVYPTKIYTEIDGFSTTVTSTATQEAVEVRTESQAYAAGGTGRVVSVKTLENYLLTSTNYYSWTFSEPKPQCSPTTWMDCDFRTGCDKCTISGGTVRLLYFPDSRTSPGGSSTTNAPVTAPISKRVSPKTTVYGNTTLTSPSVYISFHTAYAMNACGTQIGQRYPGAILALNPNSLSSINMIWGTMYSSQAADPFASGSPYLIASSFNLADMQFPAPASAYMAQPKCQDGPFGRCSVILDDYNPLLEVPVEVRAMDPAWKSCELDWQGLYDPPTALRPAEAAATPTLPVGVDGGYTSASPQSTPTSPPVETAVPKGTVQFSEPEVSQESSRVQAEQDSTTAVDEAKSPTTAPQESSIVQPSNNPVVEPSEDSAPAPTTAQDGNDVQSSGSPAIAFSEAAPAVSKTQPEGSQGSTNIALDPPTATSRGSNPVASSILQDNPSPAPQGSVDEDEEPGTISNMPSSAPAASTQAPNGGVDLGASIDTGTATPLLLTSVVSTSSIQQPEGGVAVEDTDTHTVPNAAASSTMVDPTEPTRTNPDIAASEAADEDPWHTAPSLPSASSKIGTEFLDSTGGANVILGSSTIAAGQLSTDVDGHTMFIGSESGTVLTRTLHSLQSASAIAESSPQAGESALQSRPLVVAIESRTVTEGGAAQTISGQVASVASDKIIVGSQTVDIPKTQAGTQQVSLRVGSNSDLIAMTVFAGEGTASPTRTANPGKSTASSADTGTALASTVPRAIFTFGTWTYTAIKTAGPSQAVVDGKTLSIGGTQVSLEGGSVSLNTDGQLEMQSNAPTTSASGVTVASAAAITLDSTTLTAVHPSGASKGVVEFDGTTLSPGGSGLVVGDATVSALSDGVVTLGDGGSGTVTLRKTTLTTGTSGSSSVSLVEPLGPSVTSGIGSVQTAGPSSSSTSGGSSRILPCWRAVDALLVVICGFAACLL